MYNSVLLIAILTFEIISCNNLEITNQNNNQMIKSEINSHTTGFQKGFSTFILTSQKQTPAMINFKIKNSSLMFSLGLNDGKLILNNNKFRNLEIDEDKLVSLKASVLTINSLDVKGNVKYNNVNQWKLFLHDNFHKNETSLNWNHDKVTKCNNYNIMGGQCQTSTKELIKEITNIPPHSQIKIEASYHFIGSWDSHSGYLKLDNIDFRKENPKYVWTHRCKNSKVTSIVKICPIEVCKMASPINITVNHSENLIKLIFGSTLERNSCEQSYGISDVKIYIR